MRIGHQGVVVAAPWWCGLAGAWNGGGSSVPRRSRGAREWTPLTLDAHWLIYHPPKPSPDGRTKLILSPLERIGRIAALVPPRGNPVCSPRCGSSPSPHHRIRGCAAHSGADRRACHSRPASPRRGPLQWYEGFSEDSIDAEAFILGDALAHPKPEYERPKGDLVAARRGLPDGLLPVARTSPLTPSLPTEKNMPSTPHGRPISACRSPSGGIRRGGHPFTAPRGADMQAQAIGFPILCWPPALPGTANRNVLRSCSWCRDDVAPGSMVIGPMQSIHPSSRCPSMSANGQSGINQNCTFNPRTCPILNR